ncbi:DUF4228 domain-containing protein [Quillaja saponaria]|uniref:DUF4228 domain-containing protein n=1 Tax=Quillaja saponaria TaxID=32244 RepID=A0AAD7VJ30_QUISA|nr:DUF4228 domain-containing protein [Quillaja saponaria]
MIAEPGFVVVSVNEVRRTRRLLALPADVDLLPGKAYLLVPTGRALSWASESEMEIAHQWAFENRNNIKKKKKKNSSDPPKKSSGSGSRVSPAVSVSDADNGEVEVEEEVPREVAITFTGTGTAGRLSGSLRRWNPALEPILESH